MSANNDDEAQEQLEDFDIRVLFDIVKLARTLPGTPYKALTDAHKLYLSKKHIFDHGSRWFLFLTRMHDMKAKQEGQDLMQWLQDVLSDQGITIIDDDDEHSVESTASNLDFEYHNGGLDATRSIGRQPSRRASFESFFDGVADKVAGTDGGTDLALRSRRPSGIASDTGNAPKRSRSGSEARDSGLRLTPAHGRINGAGEHGNPDDILTRPLPRPRHSGLRRSGSMNSRASLRTIRNEAAGVNHVQDFGDNSGDDNESTDSFDRSNVRIPGVNAPIPGMKSDYAQYNTSDPVYVPSDTQMQRDAASYNANRNHQRQTTLTRNILQNWQEQTRLRLDNHDRMRAAAVAFDRHVWIRAAWDSWRIALQNKRTEVETDRFFGRLQNRADKARNLFLLTKAFTHWAKSAEDEVQRTSVARRHIIRTKYFNAWRDITAVNELKIQHFVLSRFLHKWRANIAARQEQENLALNLHEHNLVQKTFWKWVYSLGSRQAPIVHETRLCLNMFERWREITAILRERNAWVSEVRGRNCTRKALIAVSQKAATMKSMEKQAIEFRQLALMTSAFSTLRTQSQLVPRANQIKQRVDTRLVRAVFSIWRNNALLSRQARAVDRQRLLRNAFTAWNDGLRVKALRSQIDDRVLVESMYKWALASRVALIQRVRNHNAKRLIFLLWSSKVQDQESRLAQAERNFADYKRTQLLRNGLQKLEIATVFRKDQEEQALFVYKPRTKHAVLSQLIAKHEHCRQLDEWANRAHYYYTAKHAIQKWRKATEYARRNKRREVYTQFRRKIKMNLARRLVHNWKDKADKFNLAERQANEVVENRLLRSSTIALMRWRDRTSTLARLEARTMQSYNGKIASFQLYAWLQKTQTLRNMDDQAVALRQESTEIIATSCLKRLAWRLWTVQRQEEMAMKLHERTFEKHVRAMVRFWVEQSAERQALRPVSPTPSSRRGGRRHGGGIEDGRGRNTDGNDRSQLYDRPEEVEERDEAGDETRRLEAWTAFDENALGLSNLDLSLTISPSRQAAESHLLPPQPLVRPFDPSKSLSSLPSYLPRRPATHPQPTSALPPPPTTIPEMPDLEDSESAEFWTSTPMPPVSKPGYLKTPSKRSVARAKRSDIIGPVSPEKRNILPVVLEKERLGIASAPPVPGYRRPGVGTSGVTSFEKRLRDGGVRKGKGRVGFGGLGDEA
ncbi:Sfi1 spindle body protein-domain-containing protein [Dendryphion nanum]|uniref:Sfi1 spindle body protein-domain-containing protein n=1 Tax=Dendryphion nanum TaxID=256645 RepID=A0A9P9EEP7_9PLEO|nr:Sfi1 spindle body protein-domain-containing protein [Dendryphion nanum]